MIQIRIYINQFKLSVEYKHKFHFILIKEWQFNLVAINFWNILKTILLKMS